MTENEALKRAVFWLSALVREADIDPDDTDITITARTGDEVVLRQEINLADDLREFAKLGARSDLLDEETWVVEQ